MTAPGTQHFTTFQTGKETTAGTSVAATREWYGSGSGELNIDPMLALHRGNRGTRTHLVGATSKGTLVQIQYDSDPDIGAAYDEMPFIWGQIDGGNSGTGSSADKTWTIAPSQTGANSQESYTIEVADDIQEYEVAYCQARSFRMSASQDSMTQLSVDWFGRAAVKSTVTSVAANKAVRIAGKLWKPKFASAQSGLAGASDTLNFLRDWDLNVTTGLVPRFYQDGLAYFGQSVEAAPLSATIDLTVESTATAVSEFYDKWQAQTVDFLQLNATGPTLGDTNYSGQITLALLYTDVKPIGEADEGVNLYKVSAETVYDGTWGNSIGAVWVCSIASIT